MRLLVALLVLLSYTSFAQNPLWLRYPAISPDGTQVAFTYQGDIYVVSTSGGRALPVTAHPAHDFMPVWLPDNKTLAFASDRFGNLDVFSIPAAGGVATRLTFHSANDYPVSVSPDGRSILFNSRRTDSDRYADFPNGARPRFFI
ncbi:MAG: hypothetical protein ACK5DD_16670 [Cyclobacteriaceae bacterium]|jgi:tricorn protease